jgi:hypothetical protein
LQYDKKDGIIDNMFKCGITKMNSRPGEKPVMLVVQTREKIYLKKDKFGQDYESGRGTEIVKEIMVRADAMAEARKMGIK